MEAGGNHVRVSIELVVRVDDPVATAAYLLGPDPEHTDALSLPPPAPLDAQVLAVVQESILDRLHSDEVHTGLATTNARMSAQRIEVPPAEPAP